jgi:hypothetical protein
MGVSGGNVFLRMEKKSSPFRVDFFIPLIGQLSFPFSSARRRPKEPLNTRMNLFDIFLQRNLWAVLI